MPREVTGLHVVQIDSNHWVENLAGIVACGAHGLIALVGDSSQ
jgi:hypothetical protein